MKRKSRKRKRQAVCASELTQMGVCERLVVFEHRFGKRHIASHHAALRRGSKAHDRFYQDGVRMSGKKGRCAIATLIFGPGPETATLRLFCDRVLRPTTTGRWLIMVYYKTAPGGCAILARWPLLQPIVRMILRPMVWMTGQVLRGNGGDDVA